MSRGVELIDNVLTYDGVIVGTGRKTAAGYAVTPWDGPGTTAKDEKELGRIAARSYRQKMRVQRKCGTGS